MLVMMLTMLTKFRVLAIRKLFWQAPAAVSDDVVDVAEEEKEEAPIVTVAHTIEAIPSSPRSPFRFVAIIAIKYYCHRY